MVELLVTVGVGSSGLVDVDKAVDWDADAVAVWLLMLAPPRLGMLLPKFCDSTTKSAKSTVGSPRKFPCDPPPTLPKFWLKITKSAKSTVPEWSASPGRTLQWKRKSPPGEPLPETMLEPSVHSPSRELPARSVMALGPVEGRLIWGASVLIGAARVQVAVNVAGL